MSTVDTQTIKTLSAAQAAAVDSHPPARANVSNEKASPASASTSQDAHSPAVVQQALAAVAEQIETYLRSNGRSLEFRVDDTTGRTVVSVRDAQTGELIRQIPGEEVLRLARALGSRPNVLLDVTA